MKNITTKKENPYVLTNKENADEAKKIAEKKAIENMTTRLNAIEENQRIHAYLLAPYAVYKYSYQYTDTDGAISTKEKSGEKLFPIDKLLNEDQTDDLMYRLRRLQGRLERLYTSRATNDREDEFKTDAKCKLQDVYSILENKSAKIAYNANLYDLETMYILAFKKGGLKSERQLSAKKEESLLEDVIYCLWSKLVEKGYTKGMKTQLPPPRPVEAKSKTDEKIKNK